MNRQHINLDICPRFSDKMGQYLYSENFLNGLFEINDISNLSYNNLLLSVVIVYSTAPIVNLLKPRIGTFLFTFSSFK